MEEPFDSRLELVVQSGGGHGETFLLDRPRVVLGRLDPGDEPTPGVIAFPDATVSRVHAHLEWDARRARYVLEHRSRTNATVVNGLQVTGSHVLEVGDQVKLGSLVCRLQHCTHEGHRPRAEVVRSIQSGSYLVCLVGPSAGAILPLNYTHLALRESLLTSDVPGLFVPGAGDAQADLYWDGEGFTVHPGPSGRPLRLLTCRPGLVRKIVLNDPEGIPLRPGSLLVCGQAVLTPARAEQAGVLRERVLDKSPLELLHPLLGSVDPEADPCWRGEQEYVLEVLSGARRGTRLWLDPDRLEEPVTVGPAPADLELPDQHAPRLELRFHEGQVLVLNADATMSFTHNWELVTPGEEVRAFSGDRFSFERTVVSFEHKPTQARVDSLSLYLGDLELPLVREVNSLGYNPQSELRVDDRRLAPTHGYVEVRSTGVFYRHKDPKSEVLVGDLVVRAGQEVELALGDVLELSEDLRLRLDSRWQLGRPGDHVRIGPTSGGRLEAADCSGPDEFEPT